MNLSLNSLNTDFQGLQDTRLTWDPYNTKFTGDDFGGKGVIGRDMSTGAGLGIPLGTSIGAAVGSSTALGSTLGSWAGPIGAAIGALIGVAAGGITGGVKKSNAEKRAESMNAANSFLNQQANNEFNNTATNIATNNWLNTMKQNSFEFGGVLNQASPYTEYNAGGSHQSNPLGGIMVGIGENGLPNKVEEGEVKYKDYVFSNKTKPSKEFQKHYKIKDKTFAEIFKTYMKAAKETENDPITKKGTEQFAKALMMEQEKVKQMEAAAQQQALQEQQAALYQNPDATIPTESSSEVPQDANLFEEGGKWKNFFKKWGTEKNDFDPINDGNLLTMSTLIPQGISVIDSLLTQPDYSAADAIAEAGRNLSYVTPTILTDRMEYTPIDTNRYLSSLRNNAAANRNQIRNIAGANRVAAMAALQGSNRDQVTAIGELMPQLEAMNEARRNQAIQFNANINAQNAAARAQADAHNMQVEQAKYNATLQALAAKEAEDKLNAQQRNQNLTSFVTNLGALGTEISNAERLRYLKDNTDMFGNFKGDSSETFGNTPETTLQNAVNNNVSNSPLNTNLSLTPSYFQRKEVPDELPEFNLQEFNPSNTANSSATTMPSIQIDWPDVATRWYEEELKPYMQSKRTAVESAIRRVTPPMFRTDLLERYEKYVRPDLVDAYYTPDMEWQLSKLPEQVYSPHTKGIIPLTEENREERVKLMREIGAKYPGASWVFREAGLEENPELFSSLPLEKLAEVEKNFYHYGPLESARAHYRSMQRLHSNAVASDLRRRAEKEARRKEKEERRNAR